MAYDFTTDGSRLLTSQGQPAANFAPSAAALFWTPGETASPGGLRLTFRHLGRVHTCLLYTSETESYPEQEVDIPTPDTGIYLAFNPYVTHENARCV